MKTLLEILRIVLAILIFIISIALLIIVVSLISEINNLTFLRENVDTTNLTNIGFALFGLCSAICFSWYKTLDDEPEFLRKYIRRIGEGFLLSGVLFLLASIFKYSELNQINFYNKTGITSLSINIAHYIWVSLFSIAAVTGVILIIHVLVIILMKIFVPLRNN